MFNAYPDSIGGRLAGSVELLARDEMAGAFSLFYVLPSIFHSDLDRGFSVVDYEIDTDLASADDLGSLDALDITVKFDLVLNHLSVGSPQFRDLVEHGADSEYADFFIDWDEFWAGHGTVSSEGYVVPDQKHLDRLFMRKPGLPILKIRFPDGTDRHYWNTFYQGVADNGGLLGQMDLNARSEKVWDFYENTLHRLAALGARILRLDAFAYLHKEVGQSNFFNRPGTWDHLERLREIADECGLTLLPEIHAQYGSLLHHEMSEQGYPVYDFFLPGLVIDAFDAADNSNLLRWIDEIVTNGLDLVNMLGCHDGIPIIDLRSGEDADGTPHAGLLTDERIEELIELLLSRGGRIKNLYGPDGEKISYYQVNATFFSAIGAEEQRLRLARAIQLFMPGTPQVWYLDLFAGTNDEAAADAAGEGGHKEINRTNLSVDDIEAGLRRPVVIDQIEMLRVRNSSPAFGGTLSVGETEPQRLQLTWTGGGATATLDADLATGAFTIVDRRRHDERTLDHA